MVWSGRYQIRVSCVRGLYAEEACQIKSVENEVARLKDRLRSGGPGLDGEYRQVILLGFGCRGLKHLLMIVAVLYCVGQAHERGC